MPGTLAEITAAPLTGGRGVFSWTLAGIDGSRESYEAARQAALLRDVEGELTLLAVWDVVAPLLLVGTGAQGVPVDPDADRKAAEATLSEAFQVVSPYSSPTAKLVRGAPSRQLLEEIEREQDTLVAVGSLGIGRLEGVLSGSVATELIHRSPCSVLVARRPADGFPGTITVGVDGSPESAAAYAAAHYLARRFGSELTAIVANGGDVDDRLVPMILGEHHKRSEGDPVDVLTAASLTSGLVVVGSRGLHGLRALGSVSERVAHQASCSTLIVREPPWQRVREELSL
jgi:nucleotide-binding universal stress UspA family protein